ncbi:MAG: hypothetical protein AVDCRST_MAG40-676, partial [uncultured Gemmatimonadaceae bacterium]
VHFVARRARHGRRPRQHGCPGARRGGHAHAVRGAALAPVYPVVPARLARPAARDLGRRQAPRFAPRTRGCGQVLRRAGLLGGPDHRVRGTGGGARAGRRRRPRPARDRPGAAPHHRDHARRGVALGARPARVRVCAHAAAVLPVADHLRGGAGRGRGAQAPARRL